MVDWEPAEAELLAVRYLLARWPDGSSLWRYPDKEEDDTSIGEVVLGYFEGEDLKDTVELWNVGPDRGKVEITRSEGVAGDESKICWFLWKTTPPGWLAVMDTEVGANEIPFLPRILPDVFRELLRTDSEIEEESASLGQLLIGRGKEWKFDGSICHQVANVPLKGREVVLGRELFEKMEALGMGRAGNSDLVTGLRPSPCLFFDAVGTTDRYALVLEAHLPNPEYTSSIPDLTNRGGKREGKQAFAVYWVGDEYDYILLGFGRTAREAMLNVTSFVWPGDEAGWAAQLPEGELSFSSEDVEVYELLGEFPPCWWESAKFRMWAEEAGLEKRGTGTWGTR